MKKRAMLGPTGSSHGVHPHDSHIFISFFKSTTKLIWQNCNLHLADKQGAKEAVLTVFFSPSLYDTPQDEFVVYVASEAL